MMRKIIRTRLAEIEYWQEGEKGPELLLLHGALASYRIYLPLIKELAKNYRVYAPTFPKMGQSKLLQRQKLSFSLLVESIWEFVQALGIKPLLVGHSLGGAVAAELALGNGQQFKGLVLVDSAGIPYRHFWRQNFGGWLYGYLEYRRGNQAEGIKDKILPQDMRRALLKPKVALETGDLLKSIDLRLKLPQIELPTMLIWGKEDSHFPLANYLEMQKLLPRAKALVISPANHNWLLYQTAKLRQLLLEFFS